jgi:hypothetical protein
MTTGAATRFLSLYLETPRADNLYKAALADLEREALSRSSRKLFEAYGEPLYRPACRLTGN